MNVYKKKVSLKSDTFFCAGAGEHDGFDEAYGPDDDPAPMPEDQRLPAPHEQPGAHHKKEPIVPAADGECGT